MLNDLAPRKDVIRVLVADTSRIHTHLLADALQRDPLLSAIPFDSDSRSLVATVMSMQIDVLVISANLDDQPSRGFEVLRELRAACPSVRAAVLLDSLKDEGVLNAFRAGARGIFGKSQPADVLSKCIRCVYQGQIWANSRELAVAVDALASAPNIRAANAGGMSLLSKREQQVVNCLAEGLTNREIADRLKLSHHTVKNYLFRVFDKLGVSSRVELLFMTLSHAGAQSAVQDLANGPDQGDVDDGLAALQMAAEAGLPAAQMALAQLYLARRTDPKDLVQAYRWCLIALERSFQARGLITGMMTKKQIEEAQQEARAWLSRTKRASTPALGDCRLSAQLLKIIPSSGAATMRKSRLVG
jgi:DNA-binding NarL/FixJ family response regulator